MASNNKELTLNENGKEVKLYQSNTIARFLAKKFGLAGRDQITQAKAELVLDHFVDVDPYFTAVFQESDPVLKEEKIKKLTTFLIEHLAPMEKILQKTKYLAGDELTGN